MLLATWLGFDRVQPNRSLLPGKHRRINALDGVASSVNFHNDRVEARVGIELSSALQTRNLFIVHSDEFRKTDTNAELRYTAGTRNIS